MRQVLVVVLGVLAVILLVTRVIGCGGVEQADVTGKVTYKGQPLKSQGATIQFVSEDKRVNVQIPIRQDGTFTPSTEHGMGLPPGTYQVAVRAPPDATGKYDDIPVKFRDTRTSGLVMELPPGGTNFDVNMD